MAGVARVLGLAEAQLRPFASGYLQWLAERPEGRPFHDEIETVLAPHLQRSQSATDGRTPRRSFS